MASMYSSNIEEERKEREWEERVKMEVRQRVARGETVTVDEMLQLKKKKQGPD